MKTRRETLITHYAMVIRRLAAFAGTAIVVLATLSPVAANAAGQLTSRSSTVTSSAGAATSVSYTMAFKTAASGAVIKRFKFEICDSPLETTSCSASASSGVASNGADLSGTGATATVTNLAGTWNKGATTGPGTSGTSVIYDAGSGQTETGNPTITVAVTGVTNPTGPNQEYYLRITTFDGSTVEEDFGAVALSTARQISVSANVQESLVFCVGTSGTGCSGGGLTGTTVNLGVGTDNVLSASTPSGGVSLMAIDTNASSGYAITYITTSPGGASGTQCPGSLSSTADCITDFGSSAGTFVAGTSKFGLNLRDNATPNIGTDISGSGSGAVSAPYNTVDNFAFQGGATPRTVATSAGPTLANLYTVAYAAQAGTTTKPGAYSATFTWIATGTF